MNLKVIILTISAFLLLGLFLMTRSSETPSVPKIDRKSIGLGDSKLPTASELKLQRQNERMAEELQQLKKNTEQIAEEHRRVLERQQQALDEANQRQEEAARRQKEEVARAKAETLRAAHSVDKAVLVPVPVVIDPPVLLPTPPDPEDRLQIVARKIMDAKGLYYENGRKLVEKFAIHSSEQTMDQIKANAEQYYDLLRELGQPHKTAARNVRSVGWHGVEEYLENYQRRPQPSINPERDELLAEMKTLAKQRYQNFRKLGVEPIQAARKVKLLTLMWEGAEDFLLASENVTKPTLKLQPPKKP